MIQVKDIRRGIVINSGSRRMELSYGEAKYLQKQLYSMLGGAPRKFYSNLFRGSKPYYDSSMEWD